MTGRYQCFLSYSHKDSSVAEWFHRALETYRLPRKLVGQPARDGMVPRKLERVFRDKDELPASADLGANLRKALEESKVLIVFCSPEAARSRWVSEEILTFKRLGRADRILAVIVRGLPGRGDATEECFPDALIHPLAADGSIDSSERLEPIAADLRTDPRGDVLLRVLAGVLGISYDSLKQRDKIRRRKLLAWWTSLLTVAAITAAGLWHWKDLQREHERMEFARQRQFEQADAFKEKGRELMMRGEFNQAVNPLLASYDRRPDDTELKALLGVTRREVDGLMRVLKGTGTRLSSFTASQDGKWMAGTDDGGNAMIWEVATGELRRHLAPRQRSTVLPEFRSVHFSPDGRRSLAWRSPTEPGEVLENETGNRQALPLAQLAFLIADGRVLLVLVEGGQTRISWWNPATAGITEGPVHGFSASQFAVVDPAGRTMVLTTRQRTKNRWMWLRTADGSMIAEGEIAGDNVREPAALSFDGARLAVFSANGWELRNAEGTIGRLQAMVPISEGSLITRGVIPSQVAWADCGRRLISANQFSTATIWNASGDASSHLNLDYIPLVGTHSQMGVAALQSERGDVEIIDLASGWKVGHLSDQISSAMPPDMTSSAPAPVFVGEDLVATAPRSRDIKLWKVAHRPVVVRLNTSVSTPIAGFSWHPDSRRLLVVQGNGTASVWDVTGSGKLAMSKTTLKEGAAANGGLMFSDGRFLVSDTSGQHAVWTEDGKEEKRWDAPSSPDGRESDIGAVTELVKDASLNPIRLHAPAPRWVGGMLMTGTRMGGLWLRNLKDGEGLHLPLAPKALLRDICSNENTFGMGDSAGNLRFWRLQPGGTPSVIFSLEGKQSWKSICLSPDGEHAAGLSEDGTLFLWSLATQQPLATWTTGDTKPQDLALSTELPPRVFAGCADGTLCVYERGKTAPIKLTDIYRNAWEDDGLSRLLSLDTGRSGVTSMAVSPNGKYIAAAFAHGILMIFDQASLRPVLRQTGGGVVALAFSPDNCRLAVGTNDSGVDIVSLAGASPADVEALRERERRNSPAE